MPNAIAVSPKANEPAPVALVSSKPPAKLKLPEAVVDSPVAKLRRPEAVVALPLATP